MTLASHDSSSYPALRDDSSRDTSERVLATGRQPISLGDVQQTLMTPLCARADQFDKDDAIVRDRVAADLVAKLDYDFAAIRRFPDTLVGCAIRAAVFDRWITQFLSKQDDTAVVVIGVGLDTTMQRIDDGRTIWFDLDFPDVIELRQRLFEPDPRRRPIAGSVLETGWIDEVKAAGRSQVLFQIAGVTMYLNGSDVRRMFTLIADHFPGSTVLFDTSSSLALKNSHRWEATVRTTAATYRWGIDDPRSIRTWDDRFRVTDVTSMMDQHRTRWSLKARIASAVWPRLRRSYLLNRAIFG